MHCTVHCASGSFFGAPYSLSKLTDKGDDVVEELFQVLTAAVWRRNSVIRHRYVVGEMQRNVWRHVEHVINPGILQQLPIGRVSFVTCVTRIRCIQWPIMVALWNRAHHYIFALWFLLLSSFFFPSPNLSRRKLDVCHTSTHGVALVQI